jgi:very-short-patch-repair endonuclease
MTREIVERAREFRAAPTQSEAVLWDALRDRQLLGVKFRRQCVIGPFVVDFCAPRQRLIIEVDGAVHLAQHEHDAERQHKLEGEGYRLLSIPAEAVETDLSNVLAIIATHLRLSHSPSPLPQAKERGLGVRFLHG